MGCNSDYMEANIREKQLQETCQLMVYVGDALGIYVEDRVRVGAKDSYCKVDVVASLCALMHSLTKAQKKKVMSDIMNAEHRSLAAWWDRHIQADVQRIANEKKAKSDTRIKAKALSKLTPQERKVLGG